MPVGGGGTGGASGARRDAAIAPPSVTYWEECPCSKFIGGIGGGATLLRPDPNVGNPSDELPLAVVAVYGVHPFEYCDDSRIPS